MMKLNKILYLVLISVLITTCTSSNINEDENAILESMKQSQEYWNSGDLDGFMHNYWKSDSLKFIGKSGVTYGWQASLDRYKIVIPTGRNRESLLSIFCTWNLWVKTIISRLGNTLKSEPPTPFQDISPYSGKRLTANGKS